MNMDIIDLVITCVFWVFLTVWVSFFAVDFVCKIIGTAAICIVLVISLVGKYLVKMELADYE